MVSLRLTINRKELSLPFLLYENQIQQPTFL